MRRRRHAMPYKCVCFEWHQHANGEMRFWSVRFLGWLAHLWGFEAAKGCGHYGMELLMMHGMLLCAA
jgi:hypothetical protein